MVPRSLEAVTIAGSRVKVVFHAGAIERVGAIARGEGAARALLVSDPGIVEAGHVERAMKSLHAAGIVARLFDGVGENPTTDHVHRGLAAARRFEPDLLIGLGGGSSMDCAKGINFLLTNGGEMRDYWGVNKATRPMLPLIAIPTTAGTGSEAQCAALITDPATHQKMACLDEKARARVAILDPELTATQPRGVAAATGIDAIAHAVETAGCTKRNEVSRRFSKAAWEMLSGAFAEAMGNGNEDKGTRGQGDKGMGASQWAIGNRQSEMLVGAHLAGCAIENSMLGAAHACANPLTAKFGIVHGHAVGVMLPQVVRFNSAGGERPYADLAEDPEALARRIERLLAAGDLPKTLGELGVDDSAIDALAVMAARQWTASFNPRPAGAAEMASIYRMAR